MTSLLGVLWGSRIKSIKSVTEGHFYWSNTFEELVRSLHLSASIRMSEQRSSYKFLHVQREFRFCTALMIPTENPLPFSFPLMSFFWLLYFLRLSSVPPFPLLYQLSGRWRKVIFTRETLNSAQWCLFMSWFDTHTHTHFSFVLLYTSLQWPDL